MANNIKCTCGHSWSKASSSKKDMYVCHICGKDNTMKDGGWLNQYDVSTAQDGTSASDRDKLMQFIQKNAGKNTDAKKTDTNVSDNKALTKEDMQRIASKSNPTVVTNTREQAETKSKKYSENVIKENKEAQEKLKKERAAANKTRSAVIGGDESAEFTFPDGTTKQWKDMDLREQSYVSGKNLGSLNNDNWTDYINPLSMLGSMAEGIGTAPYEARRTNSVMPYVSGIGAPLLTGALGGLGAKNTGQFVENIISPAPFSMSNARNFFKSKKIDLLSDRIDTGVQSQLGGLGMGLLEKFSDITGKKKGRPFSEIFPTSKSEKAKAIAEGKSANLEAEEFVKDWVYNNATDEINPEVKRKINDIMFTKGSPYATGFQQNYSPFYSVTNPLYSTPNRIVNTRYNDLIENFNLTDVDRLRILKNRGDAMGVNYAHDINPASYTFQNMGPYNYPRLEKLNTAVHEGAHSMQQLGAYEAGKKDTGFGSMLAKYDKRYKYYVPNPDTEIGRKFSEVMPTPRKGKNNWATSPLELHSELMTSRKQLVDGYVRAGYSYDDALKAARTDTDKNLDLMIKAQDLNRFFKKDVSQEKKREMLRLLPAVIPAVGAVGVMDDNEEQKRNGGWLNKFEQGGMTLEQKGDNYGIKPNPNDVQASVGPDFVGLGYDTTGRNYSPAWGGQFQNGGKATTDSVRHQANKILQYEQLRGGPGGAPLPYYSDPKYMDMLMNKVYPEVRKIMPGATAMEAGEAMDFVFNAGFDQSTNKITKDPRAFALQEYYRQYDQSKLDADGKWSGRKNAPYSFDQEYASTIGKLSENERRTLMNKGRDWYYKNINNPAPGVPNSNYNDTWYGRIWNTNDYQPFDPKNPKFTPKKQMGGSMPGAVGFMYARTQNPAPSNGKYAKKTKASAQNGKEMKFYQEGLDFKPNNIAQDGGAIVDPMGQWAHPGEVTIIPGTDITMEGVDYPVLGISDTGDTQMMYPGEDYDFDGEYVTEYPMMKEGGWLSKYQDGGSLVMDRFKEEKVPLDATRVAAPVRLTDKEQKQNVRINKQTQKNTKEYNKAVIADRKSKRETKGDVNVPGSFNITEKLRLFPESVGGVGEIINEYLNPGTIIGPLADSLGESIAARSPEGVAATLAMTAGAGALGFDPLGSAIKLSKTAGKYLTEKTALKNNYKSKLNPYSSVPGSRDLAINNILESPIDEYRNLDVFLLAKDTQKQVENEMIRRSGIENKALGEIEGSNLGVRRSSPTSKYKFSNKPYNPFSEYGYGAYDEQALKQSYSDSFDDYVRWKQNMLKKLPKNKNGGWLNKYK